MDELESIYKEEVVAYPEHYSGILPGATDQIH
jgi:hypothetical protein